VTQDYLSTGLLDTEEEVELHRSYYSKRKQNEERTPEERAASAKYTRRKRRESPANAMASRARYRAKKRGIPFTMTHEDIHITDACPICGSGMPGGAVAPSLDRLIPSLGYTPENVWVICRQCNVRKNSSSTKDLYRIADACYAEIRKRGLKEPK
jgi:hypothetical protein